MEKVEEQIEVLKKFAKDYPIPWETICELLGVEDDGLKFEGPVFQALKNQLVNEAQMAFRAGTFAREQLNQSTVKIEQLRRNIENTLKIEHRWISDTAEDKEGNKANKKFNKMINDNLEYYVEKLKEGFTPEKIPGEKKGFEPAPSPKPPSEETTKD